MSRISCGVLLCRPTPRGLEYLLAHPGGPYFAKKDDGSWGIPKGLMEAGEDARQTAVREFNEETGLVLTPESLVSLGEIRQKSGKRVRGFAALGNCDPAVLVSNTFELEWPPRSGMKRHFPEVDRYGFFGLAAAKVKMIEAQHPFLTRALSELSA